MSSPPDAMPSSPLTNFTESRSLLNAVDVAAHGGAAVAGVKYLVAPDGPTVGSVDEAYTGESHTSVCVALRRPGCATVAGVNDGVVRSDRPPIGCIHEVHACEIDAGPRISLANQVTPPSVVWRMVLLPPTAQPGAPAEAVLAVTKRVIRIATAPGAKSFRFMRRL